MSLCCLKMAYRLKRVCCSVLSYEKKCLSNLVCLMIFFPSSWDCCTEHSLRFVINPKLSYYGQPAAALCNSPLHKCQTMYAAYCGVSNNVCSLLRKCRTVYAAYCTSVEQCMQLTAQVSNSVCSLLHKCRTVYAAYCTSVKQCNQLTAQVSNNVCSLLHKCQTM